MTRLEIARREVLRLLLAYGGLQYSIPALTDEDAGKLGVEFARRLMTALDEVQAAAIEEAKR